MAKNHKLMKEISDQFLSCKICLEPFKNPKTLSCLHTFCFDCLQQHLDAESSRSRFAIYNRNITCPLCRKKTELPSGSIRRLPDNFLLSNLTEIIDRRRPSTVPPCEICPSGVRGNNASSKCLDCSKLLCKSCVKLHSTTKVTQDHTLIDIEGQKDIECKEHPEEIVRFYCDPCDTCICVVCTFQEHRDHEICSFTDGYSRYKNSMETLLDKCKKRLDDVSERIGMIDKCEKTIKETRENIRDLAISYIQQVRQTEKELLKKVESFFSEDTVNFVNNREWLQENADGLQSACNLAEIVMSDRGVEMLLLKKEMEEKLTSLLDPGLPVVPPDFQPHMIRFVPGSVSFGTLNVNNNNSEENLSESICRTTELVTSETQTDQLENIVKQTQKKTSETQTDKLENIVKRNQKESKHFSTQTTFEKHTQKEFNTELLSFRDKLTRTKPQLSNGYQEQKTNKVKMVDSALQVVTDAGSPSSGICVSCCEELKDKPTPVEFGEAPKIQEIILMNSLDKSGKEWRRMRRSMIRSRRVQTDISLSNENVAISHGFTTNVAPVSRSLSCDDVIDDKIVRSIGLDPIIIETPKSTVAESPRKRMRHKTTMTTCEMKPVVPTSEKCTFTDPPSVGTFSSQTVIESLSILTQTPIEHKSSKSAGTDFTGQFDKSTTTPQITLMDNETTMPVVTQNTTGTWTEVLQTSERAVCTEGCETNEIGTDMSHPINCDQGVQIVPHQCDKNINTGPVDVRNQKSQTEAMEDASENRKSWHGGGGFFSKLFKGKGSGSNTSLSSTSSIQVSMVDSSTETNELVLCDKETGTPVPVSIDQWTETPKPVMINTGISPPRPLYVDSCVETNHITSMDQATYTEVVHHKDVGVDTVVVVHDNETLTDKIRCQDAQTTVDIVFETNETNTENTRLMDASVSTVDDWVRLCKPDSYDVWTATPSPDILNTGTNTSNVSTAENATSISPNELVKSVERSTTPINVDKRDFGTMALSFGHSSSSVSDEMTQTFTVALYDKSVSTSKEYIPDHERKIESCEMSTSTESLPYIGLLSELEGDELFLIPESAFGKRSSIDSLFENEVEMVDDCTSMEDLVQEEISTQTLVSSGTLDQSLFSDDEKFKMTREEKGDNLVDVGVNTLPKLTFEKETSTPLRHLFSKGTMTFYISKTDKSTSTFSSTRQIAESVFNQRPMPDKTNKETMTVYQVLKDASTATENVITGGKMAECISKLKNVSDRLQSPTNKTAPDAPWTRNSSDNIIDPKNNEDIRKKQVMDLAKDTSTKSKSKGKEKQSNRKTQPITSLKGKLAPPDTSPEDLKSKSLPRHASTTVKMGSQSSASTRKTMPRFNSAPGRIATVPNQQATKKNTNAQHLSPSSKLPVKDNQDRPKTPVGTRKGKSSLPAITESRASSASSDADSYVSAVSDQSSDVLDLSSLRIPSPPTVSNRASSKSPVPRRKTKTSEDKKAQSNVGFMQKLFSKKKKQEEEKTPPSPKRQHKKFTLPPPQPPEPVKPVKPQKSKAFVYMRQRIFSIEHDNEKPARRGSKEGPSDGRPVSSDSSSSQVSATIDDRPPSTYDNL